MANATLLVNCTSVGMHPRTGRSPLEPSLLHKNLTVFDTIYNPVKTQLLLDAEKAGCAVQNGLRMLLYQGLESFKIWTGVQADESLFNMEQLQQQVAHD